MSCYWNTVCVYVCVCVSECVPLCKLFKLYMVLLSSWVHKLLPIAALSLGETQEWDNKNGPLGFSLHTEHRQLGLQSLWWPGAKGIPGAKEDNFSGGIRVLTGWHQCVWEGTDLAYEWRPISVLSHQLWASALPLHLPGDSASSSITRGKKKYLPHRLVVRIKHISICESAL